MSTEVRENIALHLPPAEAQRRIMDYVRRNESTPGTLQIPLRIRLGDFGVPGHLELARDVTATIRKRRDDQNLNDEIHVDWEPAGDGLFPSFDGWLIVWGQENGENAFVELRGEYKPPLGQAGKLFDAVLGHRIASHAATELLETLKDGIQRA